MSAVEPPNRESITEQKILCLGKENNKSIKKVGKNEGEEGGTEDSIKS